MGVEAPEYWTPLSTPLSPPDPEASLLEATAQANLRYGAARLAEAERAEAEAARVKRQLMQVLWMQEMSARERLGQLRGEIKELMRQIDALEKQEDSMGCSDGMTHFED
jgi:hypothetical protein